MIVLGLTGSIGMGKSTVAAMFRDFGIPVFDADAAVRALQGPGGKALAGIEALFPGTTHAGGLHRDRLGAQVFGNAQALAALERLIHPLVGTEQRAFLKRHRLHPIVVLDIPLLFEGQSWRLVDLTVVVSAPTRVQRARVLRRPGMTAAKLAAILATQMPDAEKRLRADVVIPTGIGIAPTRAAVRRLVTCLTRAGVASAHQCVKSSSTPRRRAFRRSTGTGWSRSAVSRSSTR
jgi:dephospho-CoA kinase